MKSYEEEEAIRHPSMYSPVAVSANSSTVIDKVSEILCGLLVVGVSREMTKQTIGDALQILDAVIGESSAARAESKSPPSEVLQEGDAEYLLQDLSVSATKAAHKLCQISSARIQKKKQTWQALQDAAEMFHRQGGGDSKAAGGGCVSTSNALALSLVFGALALWPETDTDGGGSKAAASALSSTTSRNKPLRHVGRPLASHLLRTYLTHASSSDVFQLQILNHFAKAFKLGDDCIEPTLTTRVIRHAIRLGDEPSRIMPQPNNDIDADADPQKQRVSGALALACQLQPWSVLSPVGLVDAAISFDLWHAAEEACRSAHKGTQSLPSPSTSSPNSTPTSWGGLVTFPTSQQQENTRHAVERLIDAALEDRMVRRADSLATNLYDMGGQSRYVEARYYHACETISRMIARRQIAIVDRQIERVDKAVEKASTRERIETSSPWLETSTATSDASVMPKTQRGDGDESSSRLIFDPSTEIRKFALEKLEEAGEITAAQRLASVYGIDYVRDDRALMLAAALRRRKYLQYDDLLPGSIPPLISRPEDLRLGFVRLLEYPHGHGPFGFDAEWDDETSGAAVLQLANANRALLIDIPALSSTDEGVKALRETVGKLLDCSDSVVAGFACRQDLSRLRASPTTGGGDGNSKNNSSKYHWMRGTQAVVDVQNLVGKAEPKLFKAGLSRVCQFYFGKPLDKAEQCSVWSARPLSENQRAYAALDAWVCIGIYNMLGASAENLG
jgi:hypothetical protein